MTKLITDETFKTEVLETETPVMVDFSASWCGPCRAIAPTIDKLAKEFREKVKIVKLDIEDAPTATQNFNVRGVPTFIFFKDGSEVERWVGANKSEDEFKEKLNSL